MILPPTRSLASVTMTFGTTSECFVARAWAMQRPLIPPPTTTQSTLEAEGSVAAREGEMVVADESSAIEQ